MKSNTRPQNKEIKQRSLSSCLSPGYAFNGRQHNSLKPHTNMVAMENQTKERQLKLSLSTSRVKANKKVVADSAI